MIFIGYSLPSADFAARFLFYETLSRSPPPQLKVIGRDDGWTHRDELRRRYRDVLPLIEDSDFDWGGALHWSSEFVGSASAGNGTP